MTESLSPKNEQGLKLSRSGTLEGGNSYYPFGSLFAYRSSVSNIKEAVRSVPTLQGEVEQIHVVGPKPKYSSNGIDLLKVRKFCNSVLDQLEATSASRSKFSLSEWMN